MIFGGLTMMRKIGNKGLWVFLVGIFLFLLRTSPVMSGQIIVDSDEQFALGRATMEKGEYGRAVVEFERFIHFFPESPKVLKARYLIGVCYLKGGRFEGARKRFFEITRNEPDTRLGGQALFMLGESYYVQGQIKEAEYYFNQVIEKNPTWKLKNTALYRLGWSKMKENRWKDASELFMRVGKGSELYGSSRQLSTESLKGEMLPYKDPTYAGVMAIVPGLGHVYVSRYKDAAVAFLLNGLFIWAAVEAFRNNNTVLGGVLTFFELGWYSGNIYSAVNVTHKYNRKVRDDFRNSLRDRFDIRLLTSKKGPVGLALTFRF